MDQLVREAYYKHQEFQQEKQRRRGYRSVSTRPIPPEFQRMPAPTTLKKQIKRSVSKKREMLKHSLSNSNNQLEGFLSMQDIATKYVAEATVREREIHEYVANFSKAIDTFSPSKQQSDGPAGGVADFAGGLQMKIKAKIVK